MPLAPYCLVNITLNQSIGKHVEGFIAVRNALNAIYTSFAEYWMPGLSFTIGVRTEWGGYIQD
jgi:hypothetical protein